MKNNVVVALHGSEIGNEGASLTIYETLEIRCEAFLLELIAKSAWVLDVDGAGNPDDHFLITI